MKPIVSLGFALAISTSVAFGAAADSGDTWPQWRGPNMDGVAPSANPPTAWSETQNVKWKVKLPGEGHATPIIWGNKVFIQAAIPSGKKIEAAPAAESQPQESGGRRGPRNDKPTEEYQFALVCLDRATGKTLWQKVARQALPHEGKHGTGSFASPSPVTDGQNVYAYFGSQGLYCFDMDGNQKWSEDLGDMRIKNSFGEGSSPTIHGDTIVINWDHEGDDFITAIDKNTGKARWKNPRQESTTWSTPLIVQHGGKAQVVTTATGKVRSYDLATGEQVWEHAGLTQNSIPTPITRDGIVYVMSGFRGNALYAIKLGKTGDLTDSESVLWKHAKSTPYVPSPLLVGDRLYFTSGNEATLSCFNAKTGAPYFESERIEGPRGMYASPIAAKDRVYLVGRNGTSVVVKNSDKLEILATNTLDEAFDASPAAVGSELYLRGKSHLYCIAEK